MRPTFAERVRDRARATGSWVCVGLDPDPAALPEGFSPGPFGIESFLMQIVDATREYACAFKPNAAFFEQFGAAGWSALERVRAHIGDVPVVLDAKRGDIGSTAAAYARAAFVALDADAVTVNPYLGADSLLPYLEYPDRGIFVLALTSNAGAKDLQVPNNLAAQVVAMLKRIAPDDASVGIVAGATRPEALGELRRLAPGRLFLVPGVGAQGGDLIATVRAGAAERSLDMLINASRSILRASSGADFAEAARAEAKRLAEAIADAANV